VDEETRLSLLGRIKDPRNRAAWAEFDAVYRPMLFRFAKAHNLGDADADDVVQHCMSAVYVHIDGFSYDRNRGRFKSWLRTMVNNRCRDLIRRRHDSLLGRTGLARANQQEQEQEELPPEAFEKIWMEEHLRHGLECLQSEVVGWEYLAFHRYAIEERPVAQVCAEFGTTPAQLYKIKWRLTQRLREKIVPLLGENESGKAEDT